MDIRNILTPATPGLWVADAVSKDGRHIRFKRTNGTVIIRSAAVIAKAIADGKATMLTDGSGIQWQTSQFAEPEF